MNLNDIKIKINKILEDINYNDYNNLDYRRKQFLLLSDEIKDRNIKHILIDIAALIEPSSCIKNDYNDLTDIVIRKRVKAIIGEDNE